MTSGPTRRGLLQAAGLAGAASLLASKLAPTHAAADDEIAFVEAPSATGSLDATDRFFEAFSTLKRHVVIKPGKYHVSKELVVPWHVQRITVSKGAHVIQRANNHLIARQGRCHPDPLTLHIAKSGQRHVTLADAHRFKRGHWVYLASDDIVAGPRDKRGALRQIRAVHGQRLVLDRVLNSTLKTNPRLHSVRLAPSLSIDGEGKLGFANPIATNRNTIHFEFTHAANLRDVSVGPCGGSGVMLMNTVGGSVEVHVHDCTDDQATGHYGYGVEVRSGTRDLFVGGSMRRVRHGFTTNGGVGLIPSLQWTGEPEHILVKPTVMDTTATGIDTHEAGYKITIVPNITSPGTVKWGGIDVRCRQVTIRGGFIRGAREWGILVQPSSVDCVIDGTDIRMAKLPHKDTGFTQGIRCEQSVTITGAHVSGFRDGVGISTLADTKVKITGTQVRGDDAPGSIGLRVQGSDSTIDCSVTGAGFALLEASPASDNDFVLKTDDARVVLARGSHSHAIVNGKRFKR